MSNILSKILGKRGIKDVSELAPEERGTFDEWKKILETENMGPEALLEFCTGQLGIIEAQFGDVNNSDEKVRRLVLLHSVYASIRNLINSPKAEREALITYLTGLL